VNLQVRKVAEDLYGLTLDFRLPALRIQTLRKLKKRNRKTERKKKKTYHKEDRCQLTNV